MTTPSQILRDGISKYIKFQAGSKGQPFANNIVDRIVQAKKDALGISDYSAKLKHSNKYKKLYEKQKKNESYKRASSKSNSSTIRKFYEQQLKIRKDSIMLKAKN